MSTPAVRKIGRPATGREPAVAIRLGRELTARLDTWAKEHGVTRSEAVRRMIAEKLGRRTRAVGRQAPER